MEWVFIRKNDPNNDLPIMLPFPPQIIRPSAVSNFRQETEFLYKKYIVKEKLWQRQPIKINKVLINY